jgi:hypothetical protein
MIFSATWRSDSVWLYAAEINRYMFWPLQLSFSSGLPLVNYEGRQKPLDSSMF